MEEDYPNLANVPERPDYPVSIEEQKQIIEDLRDGNIKSLDPIKSLPIKEDSLAKLSVNKNNNLQNHSERTKSIRDLQNQKLVEFELYTPKVSDNKNREEYVNEEEEELHKLSRALKNIKSQDEVLKLEKKIQKITKNQKSKKSRNIEKKPKKSRFFLFCFFDFFYISGCNFRQFMSATWPNMVRS